MELINLIIINSFIILLTWDPMEEKNVKTLLLVQLWSFCTQTFYSLMVVS